ncbi:DUF2318 domain-containing protein [Candidatus Woesearchaeota archaeon]|nr:DUF2318 domain-containing protein [Candidatus Woesearchaeota archaeon]
MISSFIITFRETLEAALIVGIVYAYLKKTQKDSLKPYVAMGVVLAVLASIIGAIILQMLYQGQETRGQQIFEGTVMIAAAFFVTTMVIWMWRSAKHLKNHIESKIDKISRTSRRSMAGVGILLFIFLMVFREGAETVLFLYGISFQSDLLSNIMGGVFGLILAVIFGILIAKGSLMVDLKKFFTVTGALLLFLVVELIAVAIHEFQEARLLIPASNGLFWDIQIWLASPDSALMTLLPLVVVPSIMIFLAAKPKESLTKPELRSNLFVKFLAGFLTIFMVSLTLSAVASKESGYDPVPIRVSARNNEIHIPVKTISENITKYVYQQDGIDMRFLLVRASDGTIRAALDACRICGPMGFEQVADTIVCKRCGVETAIDDIGTDESCNPIPLAFVLYSQEVIIPVKNFLKDGYIWTDY